MAAIYWFVFTQVFNREVHGEHPYIVFLLVALLPWTWFNGAISDSTRAFIRGAKLIRSTKIPRTIWVASIVCSKGIEFVASLPVLAIFAIVSKAELHWEAVYFLVGLVIQFILTLGIGLIVAPLVIFFRDMERAVKLVLRFLFYLSPVLYGTHAVPEFLRVILAFNPLNGILSLYRGGLFARGVSWVDVGISAGVTAVLFVVGFWTFSRLERTVLKEI